MRFKIKPPRRGHMRHVEGFGGLGGPIGRGHGRHHGGGRGRRRMFEGGELKLVLLRLIGEQSRHGYDLIRAIEERTGGEYAPSPGVVYPTLTMLEEMDLIGEQKATGAKKRYAITDAGAALLIEKAEEIAGIFARLDQLGAQQAQTNGVPIRRAMENLRTVLRHRLSGHDVTEDMIHDAAAILDEAAQKIERLK